MGSNKGPKISEICGLSQQQWCLKPQWFKSCSSKRWLKAQVYFKINNGKTHLKRDVLKLGALEHFYY